MRRLALRTLPAVLLAAILLQAAGPATPTAGAMEVAVQDDNVFLYRYYYDRQEAFAQARAIGARSIRVNLIWSDYVKRGFGPYDDLVDHARAAGLNVQFTLLGTPSYDAGDATIGYLNPSARRFGAWARTIARHFRGRVRRYSIWNEPNLGRFLSPASRAVPLYRALYRAGYAAIKASDPRAQVLIGELTSTHDPLGFLSRVSNGLRADGLAYHPFQFFTAPGSRDSRYVGISNLPRIKAALRSLARRRKLRTPRGAALPLYLTEFGYQTRGIYAMPESQRADWTVRAFALARRQGAKEMLYYMLVHPPEAFLTGEVWDSALFAQDGESDLTYRALLGARSAIIGG